MDGPARIEAGVAWEGLADPGEVLRLRAALAGLGTERRLRIGALEPGDGGVLEAVVRSVSPVKAFQRARGTEGLLARATLADGTGEVDLVLWDQETQRLADTLQVGARVRLRGPLVKAGYRGGVELGLGSCLVEPLDGAGAAATETLVGPVAVGTERLLDGAPVADAVVAGERIALTGALLAQARAADEGGLRVRLGPVQPHPVLPGWWLVTPGTRLHPDPTDPASSPGVSDPGASGSGASGPDASGSDAAGSDASGSDNPK